MLFAVALVLIAVNASAQYYHIGEEPSGLRWKQATSKHFNVIFPAGSDSSCVNIAKTYLRLMEQNYGGCADSLGLTYGLPKRFPIVLHPYNAQGNGVTVWAPRQIDMYGIPQFDGLYPQVWEEQLVLHEGRHAWQVAHFTKGIYKVLYWILGDQITGAAAGVYPSKWMLEGDAVIAETEMGSSGRGRSSYFLAYYLLDTRVPNGRGRLAERTWDQWRFGSVKNYTPNSYALGYWINSAARYETGDYKLADKIFSLEARQFWNVNVVANAFETYSGKSHKDYMAGSEFEKFKKLNSPQKESGEIDSSAKSIAVRLPFELARSGERQGYYVAYKNITAISPDSLIVLQSGYGSSPYLEMLYEDKRGGGYKSKMLRNFSGASGVLCYDSSARKIWWSEIVADPRWAMLEYGQIYSYDLKTGKTELLRSGTYWFNPSKCGDYLSVAEYVPAKNYSYLSVINTAVPISRNGKMIVPGGYVLKNKFDGQILENTFSGDAIYVTAITERGEGIYKMKFNPNGRDNLSGEWDTIIPPQRQMIKGLRYNGGMLYFISDLQGADKLYSFNPADGNMQAFSTMQNVSSYDIVSSGTSSESGSSAEQVLVYTSLSSSKGYVPYKSELKIESSWSSAANAFSEPFKNPVAEELTRQYKNARKTEPMEDLERDVNAGDVTIGNYNKLAHLLRLHSWAPFYYDVNTVSSGSYDSFINEAAPGITLYSQNTLGTAVGMLGYSYLHGRNGLHAKISYTGFYPVFEIQADYNDKEMLNKNKHSKHLSATAYIPWQFNGGGWYRGLTPQILWSYRNDQKLYTRLFVKRNVDRQQLIAALGGYCMLPVAKAQIFPRWGAGFRMRGGFNPNGGNKFGSIYSAYVYGYVPGIFWNQGLKLSAGYQYQDIGNHLYWLSNLLTMPRGLDDEYGFRFYKFTADYAIPIYLGDVSLGCVAYLKRLQIIPFADYARIKRTDGWRNFHAVGADLIVDGHIFKIGYPVSIGMRYANNGGGKNYAALLFSITFN